MSFRRSRCPVGVPDAVVVPQADVSDLVGPSPVEVRNAPGLHGTHCRAPSWEGSALEATQHELARRLVADRSHVASEEVRYLHGYLGLTQADLTARLGVERTTVASRGTADHPLHRGEALGLRALVALHLIVKRYSLSTKLHARFTTPPSAERTAPYVVSSKVFAVAS